MVNSFRPKYKSVIWDYFLIQYFKTSKKKGTKNKGLSVNMKKTKFMVTGPGLDVLRDSAAFPCAVCQHGVGSSNAIKCSQCKLWVHKRCSGIQGRIVAKPKLCLPKVSRTNSSN